MSKKSQAEKFKALAKEAGANQSEAAFKKRLRAVAAHIAHSSDCAMHNAPAFKAGACDCGAIKGKR